MKNKIRNVITHRKRNWIGYQTRRCVLVEKLEKIVEWKARKRKKNVSNDTRIYIQKLRNNT